MPAAKQKDARTGWVRPREAASGDGKDGPWVISPNEVFSSDHDLVRQHPHLFIPVDGSRGRPSVEQMTAAPGEARG